VQSYLCSEAARSIWLSCEWLGLTTSKHQRCLLGRGCWRDEHHRSAGRAG